MSAKFIVFERFPTTASQPNIAYIVHVVKYVYFCRLRSFVLWLVSQDSAVNSKLIFMAVLLARSFDQDVSVRWPCSLGSTRFSDIYACII